MAYRGSVIEQLTAHGAAWGSPETFELGRIANTAVPVLKTHDATGMRIDTVEFHPAYHALMRRSVAVGLHSSIWDASGDEGPVRSVARAARLYMTAQVECGHICPMTMTNASVAALAHAPALADAWLPKIRGRQYDSSQRPAADKASVTVGMAMTEKQGGSDVGANTTQGEDARDGTYRLIGHKWFMSAPMSDGFLALAQTSRGLTCFLVPRMLPDGTRNNIRLMRLKDKLGNRSNASAEVEFHEATAWPVGRAGPRHSDDHRHGDADAAGLCRRVGGADARGARRSDPSCAPPQGVWSPPGRPAADEPRPRRHGPRRDRCGGACRSGWRRRSTGRPTTRRRRPSPG